MVFKGSLYILNLLCGIVPCEHKYPYPDTSPPTGPQQLIRGGEQLKATHEADQVESNLVGGNEANSTNANLHRNLNSSYVDDEDGEDPLLVDTTSGKIRGYWMRIVGSDRIRAFEGIPYAEPPLNERRFQEPLPIKPWEGVLEANQKGPKCLQYNDIVLSRVVGSENCLFLNIYAKQPNTNNSTRKKPVIIFIHGGAFMTGSGNDFGPSYLLQRDLVLVTINYRLGVIGFMSTMDDASPGNSGLKDQAEAINWIHNNIQNFGGSPDKITLLGHGAGGVSVHFQMMSFKARGKFQAGISISGTAFNQWAMHMREQALNLTKRFAKALHCPVHGSSKNILSCLRDMKGSDLARMQIRFLDTWPVPLSLFRPVVEEEYQKEDPFLTDSPEEAYRKGTVDLIPWICGQAEDEGYSFLLSHVALGTFSSLRNKWNTLASDFLNYNDLPVDQDEITRRVNWLYFRRTGPEVAPFKTYSDALGARLIQTGIHKGLQAHSQFAETYAFMFGYKGKYNLGAAAGIKPTEWAVGHGEVLGYILNSTDTYPGFQQNDTELILSKILVNLVYNFANNHTPAFTTEAGQNFHVWNRITDPRNMSFLHISKTIKMIPEPYLQQTLFWESFGLPDSLPLANFSSEIQNISISDPLAKGFVSTDISVTGGSVPGGLLPPPELNEMTRSLPYFSNNVTVINQGQQLNQIMELEPFKFQTNEEEIRTNVISITESPPPTPPTSTPTPPTYPDFLPIPSPTSLLKFNPGMIDGPSTLRWLAQDYTPPFFPLPTSSQAEVSSTTPRQTSSFADVLYSLADLFSPSPVVTNVENVPHGLSVPILTGRERLPTNLVTKSNYDMNMNSLGFDIGATLAGGERRAAQSSKDETMIMMSNHHRNHFLYPIKMRY